MATVEMFKIFLLIKLNIFMYFPQGASTVLENQAATIQGCFICKGNYALINRPGVAGALL
jgi:hypothetical protein